MTPPRYCLLAPSTTIAVALGLLLGPAVPLTAFARPSPPPTQPGPPRPVLEPGGDAATPLTDRQPVNAEASTTSPVVHVIDIRPDPDAGVIKLARHLNTTSRRSGDVLHVRVEYEELCTLPCGAPVDNSERPIFFLIRDGSPVTHGFRLPSGSDTYTVKLDLGRPGMKTAGAYLTMFLLFPVGIPLLVVGKSRMWISSGDPSRAIDFVRLKKA